MTISANRESQQIKRLFAKLLNQPKLHFPARRERLQAPPTQGVYIIRKGNVVLHVGRTLRGTNGLRRRLKDHLASRSSFTQSYLHRKSEILRKREYTYQYIELVHSRKRALLEAYAIGTLCPEYIGLGE